MQAAQFCMARFWGELSDHYGRKVCLLMSAFGTSLLHFCLAFSPVLWPLYIAILVEGSTSTAYSASQGYISDVSNSRSMGPNFGLYFGLAVGGGFAVGVPLSVVMISATGTPQMSFLLSAGICAVGGVAAYFFLPESLPPSRRRPIVWRNANPLGAFRLAWRNSYITGLVLTYMLLAMARGGTQAVWVRCRVANGRWLLPEPSWDT